jgi:MoaA/NifB/PqqE/SkfB family radical SAM enzyme
MKLSGLHLLLTYICNFECDHCFVWGSPWQQGTMTLTQFDEILAQAQALGTVKSIYFEGGEPFLYYAALLRAVRAAATEGFEVGIVSNAYWAVSEQDALACLRPFAGLLQDLSLSGDRYHGTETHDQQIGHARQAAEQLDIPVGVIRIAQSDHTGTEAVRGQLPLGESPVMYRGRAVEKLLPTTRHPWTSFTECPYEDLREPDRVHLDPLGNVHLCQGISLGNLFRTPLADLLASYDPDTHPIISPLLDGGPAELARGSGVGQDEDYADACHLCYRVRSALRSRYPDCLMPDQMYGVPGD